RPASATLTPARTGAIATPTMSSLMFTRQVYDSVSSPWAIAPMGWRSSRTMICVANQGFSTGSASRHRSDHGDPGGQARGDVLTLCGSARRHFQDSVVAGVHDVDIAGGVDSDALRIAKAIERQRDCRARLLDQLQGPIAVAVGHVHV